MIKIKVPAILTQPCLVPERQDNKNSTLAKAYIQALSALHRCNTDMAKIAELYGE